MELMHTEFQQGEMPKHFALLAGCMEAYNPNFWVDVRRAAQSYRYAVDPHIPRFHDLKSWTSYLSAHQKMVFCCASVGFMRDMVPPELESNWRCWCCHVAYVRIALKHAPSLLDLITMGRLVYRAKQLFVALYGWKTITIKSHFATHFVQQSLLHGVLRYRMSFVLESLVGRMKSMLRNTNARSVCMAVMRQFWMQRILRLVTGRHCQLAQRYNIFLLHLDSAPDGCHAQLCCRAGQTLEINQGTSTQTTDFAKSSPLLSSTLPHHLELCRSPGQQKRIHFRKDSRWSLWTTSLYFICSGQWR